MGGYAFHLDAERDCASISVPYYTACRLRRKHPDSLLSKQSRIGQVPRPVKSPCLFIRNYYQAYFALKLYTACFNGFACIDHRYKSALHIRRPSAKEDLPLDEGFELSIARCGHDIIMPVKVQRFLALSKRTQ